ncbi:MAG: methyltransferase domain-containing protein [Candidatus Pacebacteria bacterium]|jgi:2-polyprenyl-3-methyl-5-hydroxy-6-metoxy-1,4-benzoquinol methylase|nr:methyltransferase domain-containing protein [Candidatus Paceibacterota bacterium]MBT3512049.1 methyltransferase domain-containing protein [Candidatus Paceibacterota bacterium]MBT4004479.1 methyltransferase domain-containing protein [Candidatus Paceibacterota bacterium]MBT4359080.1 methyltransferase domain-containing protein [Candidatus Paceibacterota bacterium]MBT4681375.1 methyltransferase domain-containing protein [Candidatus Paceibacterota bacterium]
MINNLQATISWYDDHAAEYAAKVENKAQLAELQQFQEYLSPKDRVLDAGCAAGRDSQILKEFGLEVVGVDLSQKLIEIEELVNKSGLEIIDSFERESTRPGIGWSVVYCRKITI